ncbi:MAG: chorismate mutase [Alphaproteobacteria bacterium]
MNEIQLQKLNNLREKIDNIDSQILNLLNNRMDIVSQVAELKKTSNDKFFIRSSREADMLKQLIHKSSGSFPKISILNIWRKIITSANMLEQPIKIALHNPNNISDLQYLVKEYYTNFIPITNFDSANNIVSELENNHHQIAIFALPNSADEIDRKEDVKTNWWISLANNQIGINIFAKIPFFEYLEPEKNTQKFQLVAVGIKTPEQSSSDKTLICVETAKEVAKSTILSALNEVKIEAKILKSAQIIQFEGIKFHLIELNGFYLNTDIAVKKFTQVKFKPFVKVLGHYPTQIIL